MGHRSGVGLIAPSAIVLAAYRWSVAASGTQKRSNVIFVQTHWASMLGAFSFTPSGGN